MKRILTGALLLCAIASSAQKVVTEKTYVKAATAKAGELYNKAHAFFDAGKFRDAINTYRLAIAEDPGLIDAYDDLGLSYRKTGQLDSAEYYYMLSAKRYPQGTVSLRNLGALEMARQNFDMSISYYQQALAIDSKEPECYYGLALVYCLQEKFAEAIQNVELAEKYYEQKDKKLGNYILV